MAPVERGDDIYILVDDNRSATIQVQWRQSFSSYTKDYRFFLAQTGADQQEEVPVYIASEFIDQLTDSDEVTFKGSEYYKIRVDDRFQFGERDKKGHGRFLVWHDKSRKPFQHRFVSPTLKVFALALSNKVAGTLGFENAGDAATEVIQGSVGEYLRNF